MGSDHEHMIGGYPLSEIVRRARRTADFSQRELAKYAHVSPSMIGAIEKGTVTPSLTVLERILNAANYQLVAVDAGGRTVLPLLVWDETADLAGRRLPAHLDTILDPQYGEWWADVYGLTAPPETFRRDRAYRDYLRRLSRWEVRVNLVKGRPPQLPRGSEHLHEYERDLRREARPRPR